jgi:F-type H+-transporting ATPase subunit delta
MPDSIDEQIELADVYAAALFDLAREAGRIREVGDELAEVVRLSEQEPGFGRFLESVIIEEEARAGSLEAIFRGKLSDEALNTLQVMNRHGRAGLVKALLRAYVLRQERDARQIEVVVTSAVPLDASQQQEVTRLAREISGREPLIEYRVEADILGGLVLRIGEYRYDSSLRQRLRTARQRLMERGERGLQTALNG